MKLLILLFFIAVPLAEIAVFIKVGEIIGLAATIALVIATAVIGVALLKRQGLAALARAQESVDAGELPVESVVDGVALLVAGAFLLTPGLITDTAGFLLLVPVLRHGFARWIMARAKASGRIDIWTSHRARHGGGPRPQSQEDQVIEGEYEEVESDTRQTPPEPPDTDGKGNGRSPWRK
jgi:UPF0716 protein FxsA